MRIYHLQKTNRSKIIASIVVLVLFVVGIYSVLAFLHARAENGQTSYTQGFETDASGWADATGDGDNGGYGTLTREASGTNGITAAEGSEYASVNSSDTSLQGPFTQFNGYQSSWPGTDWQTSIKVYLDPSWSEGSGFDWVVAVNDQSGNYLRDFGLLAWVYNGQLYIGGSNQSSVASDMPNLLSAANADYYTFATISQAGWYTVTQHFQNVDGLLHVELDVDNASGGTIYTKDISNVTNFPTTLTIDNTGGHRYGWFSRVNVPGGLAIDDASLSYTSNVASVSSDATTPTTATLDDGQTVALTDTTNGTATVSQNLTINGASSGAQVVIPSNTTITATDPSWSGTLPAPTLDTAVTTVNLPGYTTSVSKAVTVSDTHLTFNQPVKVTIPGEATMNAGYIDEDGNFHAISTRCASDPSTTLTGSVEECYTTSGSDLIIWTLHFSTFVAYAAAQNQTSGSTTGTSPTSSNTGSQSSSSNPPTSTSTSSDNSTPATSDTQTPPATPTQTNTPPKSSVSNATTKQTATTGDGSLAKKITTAFLGIAWYWWAAIALGVIIIWLIWVIAATTRRPSNRFL